jgi:release factor glutamine methyltransferase
MMSTTAEVFENFKTKLLKSYDVNEAEQVTILVFEHVLNYKRIDISLNKEKSIEKKFENQFQEILNQLDSGKPIQYILGYAWFYGMKLIVNESVLIPRRETEELVHWIIRDLEVMARKEFSIYDICTGSGCIALSLKKKFPQCNIVATDIASDALAVAKVNSEKENLPVHFLEMDALNMTIKANPDIVVSNPPYVLSSEKALMERKVTDFEPALALFVPDNDPLIFYRKIASWAYTNLVSGGKLYFEINESMSEEVNNLLTETGFERVDRRKDLQEKFRMFRAIKT